MDATPPPSSRVGLVKRPINKNTCHPGMLPAPLAAPVDLRDAYRVAKGIAREMAPLATPGYRLFSVGDGSHAWLDLPAAKDAYAIVGRHTQCDLRVEGDDEIALRHLLVRAKMAPESGVPALQLLDLYTSLGFRLEDGGEERAAMVVGPVAVHLGRLALVALPGPMPGIPSELPPAFVEPIGSSPYRSPPVFAPSVSGPSASTPEESGSVDVPRRSASSWTQVSLMPEAPSLHEARVTMVGETSPGVELAAAPPGFARVTLERHGRGQCVDIDETEFEAGILVGRASKCDRRFASLLDDNVSRAHLLITRDDGETVAFDLGSLNGTRVNGQRTRRFVLPDTGATLALGAGGVHLRWHPRASPLRPDPALR